VYFCVKHRDTLIEQSAALKEYSDMTVSYPTSTTEILDSDYSPKVYQVYKTDTSYTYTIL